MLHRRAGRRAAGGHGRGRGADLAILLLNPNGGCAAVGLGPKIHKPMRIERVTRVLGYSLALMATLYVRAACPAYEHGQSVTATIAAAGGLRNAIEKTEAQIRAYEDSIRSSDCKQNRQCEEAVAVLRDGIRVNRDFLAAFRCHEREGGSAPESTSPPAQPRVADIHTLTSVPNAVVDDARRSLRTTLDTLAPRSPASPLSGTDREALAGLRAGTPAAPTELPSAHSAGPPQTLPADRFRKYSDHVSRTLYTTGAEASTVATFPAEADSAWRDFVRSSKDQAPDKVREVVKDMTQAVMRDVIESGLEDAAEGTRWQAPVRSALFSLTMAESAGNSMRAGVQKGVEQFDRLIEAFDGNEPWTADLDAESDPRKVGLAIATSMCGWCKTGMEAAGAIQTGVAAMTKLLTGGSR